MKNALKLSITIASLLVTIGCTVGHNVNVKYNAKPLTVVLTKEITKAEALQAAQTALTSRQWRITEVSDNQVVGRLNHRTYNAEVQVVYDAGTLRLLNNSFNGPGSDPAFIGEPALPMGWLRNIQSDIHRQLGIPFDPYGHAQSGNEIVDIGG